MTLQTEWTFDANGKPVTSQDNSNSNNNVAIRVYVITHMQTIASAETLRSQIEALYTRRLATLADAPVTVAAATSKFIALPPKAENVSRSEETKKDLEPHSLVFLAYWVANPEQTADLVGFTRVYPEPRFNGAVGSALVVDTTLTDEQQKALETALAYASESAGEVTSLVLLAEKRAAAELMGKPVPTSQPFYRGLFLATDFTKELFASHGFIDEPHRLEMSKDLAHVDVSEPVFPDDVDVKSLDLSDYNTVQQFYTTLKHAYWPVPPSFEAWKIHYAQQPRFASELSFFAQSKTDGTIVAAIAIERIVEGEGGGDDEVNRVFVTSGKLQAHIARADAEAAAATTAAAGDNVGTATEMIEEIDDELQNLLDATSTTTLVLSPDFDAKKAAIVQQATVGYVCGVATSVKYRGKGLASGLLCRAFQVAARETSLREIILGTDVHNPSAVRAYERAGMVETKRISSGRIVVKYISPEP